MLRQAASCNGTDEARVLVPRIGTSAALKRVAKNGDGRVRAAGESSLAFDYSGLPASRQQALLAETVAIRKLVVHTAVTVVQIGLKLEYVRQILDCHQYQAWLKAEFAWSDATATRYRQSARVFAGVDCLNQFQPGAMYELAAEKVPAEAVREALARARQGERIAQRDAREIVRRHIRARVGSARGRTPRRGAFERISKAIDRTIEDRLGNLAPEERRLLAEHLHRWAARITLGGTIGEASSPQGTL